MSSTPGAGVGRPGFPTAVVVAALATSAGIVPFFAGMNQNHLPAGATVSAGWVAFGLAAALLVDRPGLRRVGSVFAVCALVPALLGAIALLNDRDQVWPLFSRLWDTTGWAIVAVALVVIALAVDRARDRMTRRRLIWLAFWAAGLFACVLMGRLTADDGRAAVVTMIGLWAFAAAGTRVLLCHELRPVIEPIVDVALVIAAVSGCVALGLAVRAGGQWSGMPSPNASAEFVAVTAAALCWPLGLWLRRSFLEIRYGRGTLSPDDVAVITAGLHPEADPRELLAKAAMMVGAASGQREVNILLGPDEADHPEGDYIDHALVVAGDRVGTLSIRLADPEGPESRQSQMVARLLPTVSLVARAVELAIEAEHARQDVARERDLERSRILGDLHDGIGPVLAGMSMRVQAERRRDPSPLLEALAKELADCRGDLRRIVSGLTPSALHDGDLTGALTRLVDSFAGDGRSITLRSAFAGRPDQDLPAEVMIALYRCVAEGITNALRHGNPTHVFVDIGEVTTGHVRVDVRDDGRGTMVVPGVGLSSLRRRAEQLGGHLHIEPAHPSGVHLYVELPVGGAAA